MSAVSIQSIRSERESVLYERILSDLSRQEINLTKTEAVG
jgi:hypothetical protein